MSSGPTVTVTSDARGTRTAADALRAFCAAEGVPQSVAWRLQVALDEVLANIASYASPPPRVVEITPTAEAAAVQLTISDDGPEFDPLTSTDPDTAPTLEARQPGGLGLLLLKRLIDDARYRRDAGRNILVLTCRLSGTSPTAC